MFDMLALKFYVCSLESCCRRICSIFQALHCKAMSAHVGCYGVMHIPQRERARHTLSICASVACLLMQFFFRRHCDGIDQHMQARISLYIAILCGIVIMATLPTPFQYSKRFATSLYNTLQIFTFSVLLRIPHDASWNVAAAEYLAPYHPPGFVMQVSVHVVILCLQM